MRTRLCMMALLIALFGVGCEKSAEVRDGFTFNLTNGVSTTARFLAGGYQSTQTSGCNAGWTLECAMPYIPVGAGKTPDWFVASGNDCGRVRAEDQATGRVLGKGEAGVMLMDENTISLQDLDVFYNGTGVVQAVDKVTGRITQFAVGDTVFVAN